MIAGDRVDVHFENVESERNVTILSKPCSDGDSWILQRDDGTQVYVQRFAKMVQVREIQP